MSRLGLTIDGIGVPIVVHIQRMARRLQSPRAIHVSSQFSKHERNHPQGQLPQCIRGTSCDVRGSFGYDWQHKDGRYFVDSHSDYFTLRCRGCELIFFERTGWCSEDVTYDQDPQTGEWVEGPVKRTTIFSTLTPEASNAGTLAPHKLQEMVKPLLSVDTQLFQIMYETYQAEAVNALILAAVGLRTAFDRATEVLKIHPGHTLENKVKELLEEGFVGETEALVLKGVVDAGNAAAHRSWQPNAEQFRELLAALEHFLLRVVLKTGRGALDIAAGLPPRHPRPPSQG
ncbi:DUF4145 domain-containing protein [Burkholderia lata]|uniref:DUF4145 domain-containing protein n=1 Tax=Burkholderia lata (strain ATCC 17760 / DSM 23089 / LMG 22485 / NCIMB 9086 / R18194 / 383) TaxID=482957 RepID=UPI001582FBCA|nr:DUF4145 domain-containing protein [Burkholderia lata]